MRYSGSGGARAPSQGSTGSQKGRKPGEGHKKRAFGGGETVTGGVKRRAVRRIRALGGVEGVSRKGGITGREARKVRGAWMRAGRPSPKPPQRNAPARNPASVIAPLTPRDLRREVSAGQSLRYGPELRQIDASVRGSQYRSDAEIPQWFQNFLNTQQQAEARAQGYWQGAQQNILNAAQQQQGVAQQQIGQHQQQAQQDAAIRGSTPDQQPFLDATMGAQANFRGGLNEAAHTGNLGAAAGQDMAYQQVVGAQKMLEALNREGRVRETLRGQKRDVLAERGQYGVDLKRQIRGDEREWAAIVKEFGLKETELGADIADQQADNRRQARSERRQAARDRLLNAQTRESIRTSKGKRALDKNADLADDGRLNSSTNYSEWAQRTRPDKDSSGDSKGPGGRPTSVPPSERSENQRRFRSLTRYAQRGEKPPGDVDPLMKRGVEEWIRNKKKGVSPKTARRLWRDFGIKVPVLRPGPHDIGAKPSPLGPK